MACSLQYQETAYQLGLSTSGAGGNPAAKNGNDVQKLNSKNGLNFGVWSKGGENLTVVQLLEIYRERYAKDKKNEETLKTDGFFCRKLVPYFGELFLNDLTSSHIEDYIDKRRSDGVSDITIHHELRLLRHAFSLAVSKWKLVNSNPFDEVELPKGDKKRIRYLSPEEVKLLFEALEGKGWFRSVIILARETGLRLTNICDLTWKQADLFKRHIEIEKTKNGNPVCVPMTEVVHSELVGLNKVRDLKSDRVFIVDGKFINRHWVSQRFNRLCKRIHS